jgi:uncharacterized metal-binding protein YceD (DUF177 family)
MKLDYLKACKHQYELDRHMVIRYDESHPFITEGAYSLDVQASFSFMNQCATIQGTMQGSIKLICQNCLQTFVYELKHSFALKLIRTSTQPLPKTAYYVCTDKYLDISQLLKEEVLLNIPSIPKHCILQ